MVLCPSKKMVLLLVCLELGSLLPLFAQNDCSEQVTADARVERGHAWRPPFGLARVGEPVHAVVEITSEKKPTREYSLVGYLDGNEIGRYALNWKGDKTNYTDSVTFESYPAELVLYAKCHPEGQAVEVARKMFHPPPFEADAVAGPDEWTNPVDLGAILVPADWLLLGNTHSGSIEVAAISRTQDKDIDGAQVRVWFESAPREKATAALPLTRNRRVQVKLRLPAGSHGAEHDLLHVAIVDGAGRDLWEKTIKTMRVARPPLWPKFGATTTKLRYDAPISVREPKTGKFSFMSYDGAWDARFQDVVVSLPNGSRFVFWRGSSYVPFWAGQHNTGLTYEWAERQPPPEGFADSVEPLMDKELRYARVEIVESTAARVHVRWSYQSCDFNYKVFGDTAFEDFYFYPDSFGTRGLTIRSAPAVEWEVSEFIVLTPQAAYPLAVLPRKMVDILFLDGTKREVSFPFHVEGEPQRGKLAWPEDMIEKIRAMPAVYRVRLEKDEAATAIYFNPFDPYLPHPFASFLDRGEPVTPAYWGSHWPLGRGKTTGWAIDDRIYVNPGHNSLMTWAHDRPVPIRTARIEGLDALGQSRPMVETSWAWLIGMTEESDERLLEWVRSFMRPPSIELRGARLEFDSYVPERRAMRLFVEDETVAITIKPTVRCVNPVFELTGDPGDLARLSLGDRALHPEDYAWDGKTLWLKANIDQPQVLRLVFSKSRR